MVSKRIQMLLELLRSDGPRIHVLLTRLTLRADVAEDLMQDLFLRLRDSEGFGRANDSTGYAVRTATNLAFEWRRKQKQRRETQLSEIEPKSSSSCPLAILEKKEQFEQILGALDEMSDLSRQVVIMNRLEGQPYASIAKQLGKTPHQVRALVSKAVRQLKSVLGSLPESAGKREKRNEPPA